VIRLLWKEWHELKWYLIALALGPWLLGLVPSSKLGYDWNGIWSLDVQVLMLVLAFWAGTRMPGEMRPTRFGVGWLPIRPWKVWLVKFAPGFLVAVLLPLWIHVVAFARVHPIRLGEHETALMHVAGSLAYALSLYTCAFAVSMFASSVVAILCAYVGAVILPGILLSGPTYFGIRESAIQPLLSGIALAVGFGVWTKGRGAGIGRKSGVMVIAAFSGLLLGVLVLALIGIVRYGSVQALRGELDKAAQYWAMSRHTDQPYEIGGARELPSPDGRALAYARSFYAKRPRGDKSARKYRGGEVRIRDWRGDVAVLKRSWASPAAWLPDGKLLVVIGREGHPISISEWDPPSGGLRLLARMPGIACVAPDRAGDKIAVLTSPRRGYGLDLWILDRHSRRLKLLRPGLGVYPWEDDAVRWDGDRLVFYRGLRALWSIRADGSDLRQALPTRKEARGG
jgi:hypothetical protein